MSISGFMFVFYWQIGSAMGLGVHRSPFYLESSCLSAQNCSQCSAIITGVLAVKRRMKGTVSVAAVIFCSFV